MAKRKDMVPTKKTTLPAPEALKASLATAKTTGEVKPVHTAAKALKAAAKVAGNRQDIAKASEIVWRAERKLGQMMEQGKDDRASHGGNRRSRDPGKPLKPTLAEIGVDKNLAYRARKAAEWDDESFEVWLEVELDEILNPAPTYGQQQEERKEWRRLEREKAKAEGKPAREADRCQREEERRENEKWEEEQRAERAAEPVAEIIPPKRRAQSVAPEIISPTFTANSQSNAIL